MMRRAKTTPVEPMPDHSPVMSRMVGKGKAKKMMMKEESESEEEMTGGRIELSKLIALGKNGQHYMLDPSMFATKPRVPLPRDNVSGKGRRVLEGGVLGAMDPSVEYRDTLSGAGKERKSSDNFWATFGDTQDIATATTSKGPSSSGRAGAGKLKITHEGMGKAGAGKAGAGNLHIKHEGMGMCGAGKMDGRKARAEIVKKVMKERGIKSLAEASKIVKSEGLY